MRHLLIGMLLFLVTIGFLLFFSPTKGRHRHPRNLRKKRNETVVVIPGIGPVRVIEDPNVPADSFFFIAQDSDIA